MVRGNIRGPVAHRICPCCSRNTWISHILQKYVTQKISTILTERVELTHTADTDTIHILHFPLVILNLAIGRLTIQAADLTLNNLWLTMLADILTYIGTYLIIVIIGYNTTVAALNARVNTLASRIKTFVCRVCLVTCICRYVKAAFNGKTLLFGNGDMRVDTVLAIDLWNIAEGVFGRFRADEW